LSGAITRNEIRASVGLNAVPWGEQPLVPNNMVEVDPSTGKPQHFDPNQAIKALAGSQAKIVDAVQVLSDKLEGVLRSKSSPNPEAVPVTQSNGEDLPERAAVAPAGGIPAPPSVDAADPPVVGNVPK